MTGTVQLCAFRVGGDELVIDLMRVVEILSPPPLTPMPRSSPVLEGVVNLRGAIVPVVDVRRQLGAPVEPGPKVRLVVCKVGERQVGLLVDAVSQVLRADAGQLKPAPVSAGSAPHVLGLCTAGDRLRLMLDVKALLKDA